MTNTPETDVRTALNEAATVTGLGFDEAAVLSRGHRVVRRRRVVAAAAGVAAIALGTIVALQVSGNGFNRALPPATSPTATVVAVAGPIDESGEVAPGIDDAGVAQGYGVRLTVKGGATGKVVETWTVLKGTKAVKTITRSVSRIGVGQASLVLPAESGIPGLVLGYANTGSDRSVYAGINAAPEQPMRGDGGASQLTAVSGATRTDSVLFVTKYEGFDPSKIVGLSWGEASDAVLQGSARRSILLNAERTDLLAAILTEPDGNQWISWASATQIGVASSMGTTRPAPATGALQVLGLPGSSDPTTPSPDKIFGWVTGGDDVTVSTTSPDTTVISYAQDRSGRRPFLITSKQGLFTGPVTVTGAGVTQTVDLNALRNAPQ